MSSATLVGIIAQEVFDSRGAATRTIPLTWKGQVAQDYETAIGDLVSALYDASQRLGNTSQLIAQHEQNLQHTQLALGAGI